MSPFLLLLSLVACEDDKGVDTATIDTAIITPGDDTGVTSTPTDSVTSDDTGIETGIITPGDDTGTTATDDTGIETGIITTGDDTGGDTAGTDTVDTEEEKEGAPEVAWLDPTGGEYLYGAVDLLVDAVDDVLVVYVEYYVDGGLIDYDIDGEPWQVTWDSDAFSEGPHTLTAIAYDDVSEAGEASIDVIVDRTPPDVIIDNPTDGADVSGVVSVEANVVEVNLDYVEFYIDGALVSTYAAADPLVYSWDTRGWDTGSYPIEVIAYDLAGHSGSDNIDVNVVSAPDVYIIEPGDSDVVSGTTDLVAEATDDGTIEQLEFTLNGLLYDTLTGASPYSSSWDTCGVTPGYVVIEADALDDEGLTGSDSITVEVDQPFEIDIIAPSGGAVEPSEALLNTLYDDRGIVSVEWDVDGASISSSATSSALPGDVTCAYECGCDYYDQTGDMTGLGDGTHTLTVTATNDTGETASDSVTITIDSDEDDDGTPGEEWGGDDCDDSDADINPDADELCDGIDNDCDGLIDEDPTDGDTYYADDDSDGFGDAGDSVESCDEPTGYVENPDDCDDTDSSVNPDANEICSDGIDNDCDGTIDEADGDGGGTWYADDDGDGYGDPGDSVEACEEPPGYTDNDDDCDDTDGSVNPDADEICDDGIDNDCDGLVDEIDGVGGDDYYADDDGDGFGDPGDVVSACDEPDGYTDNDDDCDDTDGSVNPDADEICGDGIDNDCDGTVDEADGVGGDTYYADDDSDGYGDAGDSVEACEEPPGYTDNDDDCDDTDVTINPDADEICDGVDNDCDGTVDNDDAIDADTWYADDDGDGFGDAGDTTDACDEPDGYTDNDDDCDDTDVTINPDADEICDGVDNDCDGLIDDDDDSLDLGTADTWYIDDDGDGYGDPGGATVTACDGPPGYEDDDDDCDDTDATINPDADEICDGVDNDCDGGTSEDGVVTLDGSGTYTTIQSALNLAGDGSVLTICYGTYYEALTVNDAVTLESLNGASAVTINANSGGSAVNVSSGASVEIQGLTLTGGIGTYEASVSGRIGGGVNGYYADGIEIYDSIIEYNSAGLGGGVFGSGFADDIIEDTVIRDNSATYGGGVAGFGFAFAGVDVENNDASYGGGLWLYADLTTMDADTVVADNYALIGGGVYLDNADLVLDPASTIMNNEADLTTGGTGGGGGLYMDNATLSGGIVSGNTAGDYAGGIFVDGSSSALDDVAIEDNEADYGGGGVLFYAADITVTDLNIAGNSAYLGGGVWAEQLNIELRNCTIEDNSADYGGAILAYIADDVNLRSSIINDNSASVEGGGAMVIGYWVAGSLVYDSQISSTSSDWGSGSTNNSPEDVWVDAWDTSYNYGTSSSFTCSQSLGGCF